MHIYKFSSCNVSIKSSSKKHPTFVNKKILFYSMTTPDLIQKDQHRGKKWNSVSLFSPPAIFT